MSMTIDCVDPAQERQDLLDVARREHLGHLDARRREQDVDPRRVAPQDVAEVRLGDPVGRQVEDRRGVDRDLEQRAQVAELEAAVDEDGPLLELAERDREVERDGRLADAALRREDAQMTRVARDRLVAPRTSLRDVGDPGHQVEAGERHRQDAVDALLAGRARPGSAARSGR